MIVLHRIMPAFTNKASRKMDKEGISQSKQASKQFKHSTARSRTREGRMAVGWALGRPVWGLSLVYFVRHRKAKRRPRRFKNNYVNCRSL